MGTSDECLSFMFSECLRLDRVTPHCTMHVSALAVRVVGYIIGEKMPL